MPEVSITNDWEWLITFLKIAPGLALFPLAYVLARRKIRHKAEIFYTWTTSMAAAEHISWMLIRNLKEKPLEIFAIHAVVENDLRVEIYKSRAPIIIKSMECIELSIEPVSFYSAGEDQLNSLGLSGNLRFYITTTDRIIKCHGAPLPIALEVEYFGDLRVLTPVRRAHNDVLYTAHARFAIDFKYEGDSGTAILLANGWMHGSRPLHLSRLDTHESAHEIDVIKEIERLELFSQLTDIKVTRLNPGGYRS